MKKRVLSVLLIIVMLMAVGILSAQADNTPNAQTVIAGAEAMAVSGKFNHFAEGETAPSVANVQCPVCGTNQTWTALTANKGSINSGSSAVIHYYVARETIEVPEGGHISVGGAGTTHLYLNNSTFTANGASGYSILRAGGGNVTIFGEGKMVQNGSSAYTLYSNGGTFDIYGGTYTSANATNTFYTNSANSRIDIYNGSVDKVNANSGELNIHGGDIGSVIGGANITALTLQGNPIIDLLDMTNFGVKATVGALTEGADITVKATGVFTANDASAYAKYFSGTEYWTGGIADGEGKLSIGRLPIETSADIINYARGMTFPNDGTSVTQYCPTCKADKTWTAMTASTGTYLGTNHFYLSTDITRETAIAAYSGKLCVHLNGNDYSLESTANTVQFCFDNRNGHGINIFDSNGGTVTNTHHGVFGNTTGTGDGAINLYGGTFTCGGSYVVDTYQKTGELNLYAGELGVSNTYSVYVKTGGAFNMYGGVISGKTVYTTTANNSVSIQGGRITGDGVTITAGTLTVSGGEISKIVCAAGAGNVTLTGVPVINELDLTSGKTVTIGALTEGADITVNASAVFTANDASDFVEYFSSSKSGFGIEVDSETGVLSIGKIVINGADDVIKYTKNMRFPTDGKDSTQFCPTCQKDVTWKALTAETGNLLGTSSGEFTHYYLSSNITRTKPVIAYYGGLCVHLNNYEYTFEVPTNDTAYCFDNRKGYGINVFAKTDGAAINTKFAVFGNTAGTGENAFHVYGGTYTTQGTDTVSCGSSGEFNIYNGILNRGTSRSVWMSGNSVFNMYGGECRGRIYSDTGARIYIRDAEVDSFTAQAGEAEVNGAVITGTDIYIGAANIILSGSGIDYDGQINTSRNATLTVREDYTGTAYAGVFIDDSNEPEYGKPVALSGDCGNSFTGAVYKRKGDITYGIVADGNGGLVVGTVAVTDNAGNEKWYANAGLAAAAAQGTGNYVRPFAPSEAVLHGETMYLDMNGQNMKISGTGTVVAKDSANMSFMNYGKMDVQESEDLKIIPDTNFVKITDMKGVHFHYYEMKLSGVTLKPGLNAGGSVGLYYSAVWNMDETLKKNASAGVVLGLKDNIPTADFYDQYEEAFASGIAHKFFFYDYDGTEIVNGEEKTSVLVSGILKATKEVADNDTAGQTAINAAAFLALDDQIIVSPVKSLSAYDVLALLQKGTGVTPELEKFYSKWNQYSNVETIVAKKVEEMMK